MQLELSFQTLQLSLMDLSFKLGTLDVGGIDLDVLLVGYSLDFGLQGQVGIVPDPLLDCIKELIELVSHLKA